MRDPRLEIAIGPTVERSLLDVVFGQAHWCQVVTARAASPLETTTSDVLACLGLQKLLDASRDAANPQAQALDRRIRSSIGAIVAAKNVADVLQPGSHASTYGGNPLVCAASLAVISVIEEEKGCEKARAAEKILKQISVIIKDTLRETDIIGRISKDTFAISMPETSNDNCVLTISRMNKKIMELPIIKTCKFEWGIATKDDKTKDAEDLLKFAEHAAKESFRNIHRVKDSFNEFIEKRKEIKPYTKTRHWFDNYKKIDELFEYNINSRPFNITEF